MSKEAGVVCGVLVLLVLVVGSYIMFFGPKGEKIPKLSKVEGTLTLDEEPLGDVKVTFLPDPEEGVIAGPSVGVTDSSGKFTVFYREDKDKPGVAIGKCRVILNDLVAKRSSREENPTPPRFSKKFSTASSTTLSFDVKDQESQTIDIEVGDE